MAFPDQMEDQMNPRPPPEPPQGEATTDHKAMPSCPYCGHSGTLAPLSEDTVIDHNTFVSVRQCLNEGCHGIVFYYRARDGSVRTLPYREIGYGKADPRNGVRNALEEATICHAQGCYAAAAVMVRRALAELCEGVGIVDGELLDRLDSLGKLLSVPPALLGGLRDLRMLGNAAASSESAIYSKMSRKEVKVGIDCTEAIFKALYRYESLVGKLKALKDQRPTPS
jgi:Domain of unknown function (DUF4145)